MLRKVKDKCGFTLVELLVVIAIIGILAAVAVPKLFNSAYKAKVSDLEYDYRTVQSALLSYYADNGTMPYFGDNGLKVEDSSISIYMEGINDKSPIGGGYSVIENMNEGVARVELDGGTGKNGLSGEALEKINQKIKAILKVDYANGEYPQLTKKQAIRLVKDIGYGNVYVDGPGTFDDGLTTVYLVLIED